MFVTVQYSPELAHSLNVGQRSDNVTLPLKAGVTVDADANDGGEVRLEKTRVGLAYSSAA